MLQFSIHRFLCTIVRQSHASACGTALRTGACRAIVVSSRLQSFASRGPLSASLSSPSEPAPAPSTVPAPEVAKIVFVAGISFSGSTLTGLLLGSRPNAIFGGELKDYKRRMQSEIRGSGHFCSCGGSRDTCPFWSEVQKRYGLEESDPDDSD